MGPARREPSRAASRRPSEALSPSRLAYHRLSESPLWSAQRRYYEGAGIDAWRSGTVPHHVTSNVALATAYARIVAAFARDSGRPEPLDVLELGAGSGRFAFLFLRALDALGARAPSVRYVMTDVAESTVEAWRQHEAFRPFVRAGRLAFARLDLAAPEFSWPRGGGTEHARLVVIANYVFSGLPHDAYVFRAGSIHEYLVATSHSRANGTVIASRDATTSSLGWRMGGHVSRPYPDDDFNDVLRAHTIAGSPRVLLFPVGALRALKRIGALGRSVLALVADRGTEESAHAITPRHDLGLARHGAISFPVNFPVLRSWVSRRGGTAFRPPRPEPTLHIAAVVLGGRSKWPATRHAYETAMRDGGPAAVYRLRRALETEGDRVAPAALLQLMKRAGPDPRVVAECARPLWPHLADAGPRLRRDIARAVLDAWPNYFHVDERDDVPFALALVLYEVRAYEAARELFEASLRHHGDDAATWWNVGLCHVALGRPHAARAAFRRARSLAPGRHAAGLATRKARHASHRGR